MRSSITSTLSITLSWRLRAAIDSSLTKRSRLYFTASASTGSPEWKVASGCRVKV